MPFFSNRALWGDLRPGDHIYSWRWGFITYAHHGVYVGNNRVIHFTRAYNGGLVPSSNQLKKNKRPSGMSCEVCGLNKGDGGVIISCLSCFLDGGSLSLYEYGVYYLYFNLKLNGTCSTFKSDNSELVTHRAYYHLKAGGFGSYHLQRNNCESFAFYCKTGKRGCSAQIARDSVRSPNVTFKYGVI